MIRFLIVLLFIAGPLAAADLASLQKELTEKKSALAADDIDGRHKLAKWCKLKKLHQSELRLYREILKLSPNDAQAHLGLQHVLDGKRWYETEDALQLANGKFRRLSEWVTATPEEKADWRLVHDHWLSADEITQLDSGIPLKAHSGDGWLEVLTREYRIRSALKEPETIELARVLEQAIRIWREDAGLEYDARTGVTLWVDIMKDHDAFVEMIESDIESFDAEMTKSQGFFDGQYCRLSYFHDWYRTRRVLLHEARHQFDGLVTQKLWNLPAWYKEGIAEYWSMHKWDGKKLELGQLVPDVNYSLYFCGKLLRKKKIKGAEDTLNQNWWGEVDPEFYQNSWAFIYFLRNSDYRDGFAKFETQLLAATLDSASKQLESFKQNVSVDLKAFDDAYHARLKTWCELSPPEMR
ncbi:MAG: hypothetical protein KDB90_15295 [Planctomycetes bacterium]|nr:hypothetical protein [Planctomycetota bacterium]